MKTPLQQLMNQATALTRSGKLLEATGMIRDALVGGATTHAPAPVRTGGGPVRLPKVLRDLFKPVDEPKPRAPTRARPTTVDDDNFIDGSHSCGSTTRQYKLFVPAGTPRGLVLMLHGCTQDPADFARGTRMNEHAGSEGMLVLYPAQSKSANPSACWNWFDVSRRTEEVRFLADLTRTIVDAHDVDPDRVFVAGMSAGGAMAAIVSNSHPDLFAAAGVHSGLAAGAADNLPDALSAMRTGKARGVRGEAKAVPTIVFHGADDPTVHPSNGDHVVASIVKASAASIRELPRRAEGAAPGGRAFTRTEYVDSAGKPVVEQWVVHASGHAWSGGDSNGSHTDPLGVDASAEMLRFFVAQGNAKG